MFSSSGLGFSCGSRGCYSHLWLFVSSLTSIFMEGNRMLRWWH